MNNESFFENEFANIFWDKEIMAATIEWKKPAREDDFRAPLLKLLELAIIKNATKIFANTLSSGVSSPNDIEWTNTVFNKKINDESKIKSMAFIIPKSVIAKMALDRHTNVVQEEKDKNVKFFDDIDEAKQWLSSFS